MSASEDVDVLIVGAGISGIGAARHLLHRCPGRTFTILEGREDIGGTWDLFRYPGVRSDSDMHTLGYEFRPWVADDAIADGPAIMQYLRDTVAEEGIGPRIRFGHRVTRAEWVGEDARWTVRATGPDGSEVVFTANFLFVCAGYYSYRHGYTPDIPGLDRFSGPVIHPQEWPEDLEVAGKRIVVIGSGATAMTLVPALAERGATVTMLQRSPSYVVSRPRVDRVAIALRRVLPAKLAYRITRLKNTTMQQFFYERARRRPQEVKTYLVGKVAEALPGMDVEKHFTPSYAPWDQRVCLVPDGDLFDAIRSGRVEVVTDTIDHVDATGIVAGSGTHLDADILITATGLELVTLGEIAFTVDGEPVDFGQTWSYKGLAYSDVPNLASSFGYVNASWTLRTDLICGYVCRLLDYMDRTGTRTCTPRLRPSDAAMTPRPWVDGFTPGYITRHLDRMPRQGDREPWINPQNYARDRKLFAKAPVDDGVMQFR